MGIIIPNEISLLSFEKSKVKKADYTSVGEDEEQLEVSYPAGGIVSGYNQYRKQFGRFL